MPWPQRSKGNRTEAALQRSVRSHYTKTGWWVFHTPNSIGTQAGEPDLRLVHKATGVVVWMELKSQRGQRTDEQTKVGDALERGGHHYLLVRWSDWDAGSPQRTTQRLVNDANWKQQRK